MADQPNELRPAKPDKRINLLRIFFITLFAIYSWRLFYMQIFSGDIYRGRAQDISRRTEIIPSQRGEIYDRSYVQPIALNTDSFAVSIVPAEVAASRYRDCLPKSRVF